jgi:hypothetical protein
MCFSSITQRIPGLAIMMRGIATMDEQVRELA